MLPTVRSLLKLYTTIGIPKLAELLDEVESGGTQWDELTD